MTKLTFAAHPFLLGFDQLERLVERTAKSGNDGYPPFNIEQSSEHGFRKRLSGGALHPEQPGNPRPAVPLLRLRPASATASFTRRVWRPLSQQSLHRRQNR